MSRHKIEGLRPESRVVVGWDQSQRTFFVHVHNAPTRTPSVWLGTKARELPGIAELRLALAPHAILTDELAATLLGDQEEGQLDG